MAIAKRWAVGVLAAVVGIGGARALADGPAPASDASPTPAELQRQIKELQQKVDQLQTQKPAYNQQEIDQTVQRVLDDAKTHNSLMDAGSTAVTAGFDVNRGFFICNADQSFYIHPGILFQFRGVASQRLDQAPGTAGKGAHVSDTQMGFETRRLKPYIDGNAFSKDFTFKFQWKSDPDYQTPNSASGTNNVNPKGAMVLDDAFVQDILVHTGDGAFAVKAGQFKVPVFKEETMGDQFQLAVDRSFVNYELGGSAVGPRTKGVDLLWTGKDTPLHAEVLLDGGDNSLNTNYQQIAVTSLGPPPVLKSPLYFGVATREDYKVFGPWSEAGDFTAHGSKADFLDIGGGFDFSQKGGSNVLHATVDTQYKIAQQWGFYGALLADQIDNRGPGAVPRGRNDWGALVQAGYMVMPQMELFARYDFFYLDGQIPVTALIPRHHYQEYTAGMNWFFGDQGSYGHHLQFALDISWLPDGGFVNGGTTTAGDTDILPSLNGSPEWLVRSEIQFWE